MTADGEWIEHDGGECPVDADTRVDVRFRKGEESVKTHCADMWLWPGYDGPFDITAYRLAACPS